MKVARKVTGVVISSKDYKEKDKLISLFTVEEGLVYASMRGVRGDKAKMKSALFRLNNTHLHRRQAPFLNTS